MFQFLEPQFCIDLSQINFLLCFERNPENLLMGGADGQVSPGANRPLAFPRAAGDRLLKVFGTQPLSSSSSSSTSPFKGIWHTAVIIFILFLIIFVQKTDSHLIIILDHQHHHQNPLWLPQVFNQAVAVYLCPLCTVGAVS